MLDRFFPQSEIVQVETTAQVADQIAAAHTANRPVYPVGGATTLGLGASVDTPGTVLSLAKLNRLIDYPARDLTITVEAGMTIAELQEQLAAENQCLPLDIPDAEHATVGGAIAANLSGPRRYRCGTIRDYLLGLTIVDGTGRSFSTGGQVVKNAAGYDLTRLMIGTLGTIGVVTEATLMVRPQPEKSAFLAVPLPTLTNVSAPTDDVAASGIEPTAIELLLNAKSGENGPLSQPLGDADHILWLGFEGSRANVQWMLDESTRLGGNYGLKSSRHDEPQQVAAIWNALTDNALPPSTAETSNFTVEATLLPADTLKTAEGLREMDNPPALLRCRPASGVITAQFACRPDQITEQVTAARRVVGESGKTFVLDHPPECRLDQETVWGPRGDEFRIMQRLKQQFDPHGILNPGRFVF